MESESRLDHEITSISGAGELKAKQRERLDRVQALQRIVVGLLERTRLHSAALHDELRADPAVTVIIQAIHAAHARRMIIDCIDYSSPTMVIIGSRGLTGLKTSLLGSVR